MAADSAKSNDGSIECPKCGCRDFRVYSTPGGNTSTFRYKQCRHCGHRVLTTTSQVERIVRDVRQRGDEDGEDDDECDSILSLIG